MSTILDYFEHFHLNSAMLILLWLLVINLIAFITMGRDKHKARSDAWRIPEATLFLLAIIGGSIGSIAGMFVFHHKTRKAKFQIGMPLILILQIALIALLVISSSQIVFL